MAAPVLALMLLFPDRPYFLLAAAAGHVGHNWPSGNGPWHGYRESFDIQMGWAGSDDPLVLVAHPGLVPCVLHIFYVICRRMKYILEYILVL